MVQHRFTMTTSLEYSAHSADGREIEAPDRPTPQSTRSDIIATLAGVGWFEVDDDRQLTAVSPELERITGFSAREVIGKPCISLIRCPQCLKGCGVFRHGHIQDTPLRLFHKNGHEIDVVRSGQAMYDGDGRITGAIETVRLADRPSSGPSEQIETLLGSLGRNFVIADGELRTISASTELAVTLGIDRASLTGLPLTRIFGESALGDGGALREAITSRDRREGLRAELHPVDGRRLPVSVSVGPIDEGTHCGIAGARVAIMIRESDEGAHESDAASFEGIVGRSPAMQRIFRLIELLHDNDATVLVTGESGTGKEMVARALHARSGRHGPFVAVNCAALPGELLESELFGHVRGAFTGAVRDRPGRFEVAEGGTIFLDEIGDMPAALQAKLLRVLQDHAFERVGESVTRHVDVRVIAATHIDLARAVAEHRFREDLFYRLRVVPIHVPALRERRDDLTFLIPHLLQRIGARRGRALQLSPAALQALVSAPWPGNIRELENALEYATALCGGQTIHPEHLPPDLGALALDVPREKGGTAERMAPALTLSRDEQEERERLREVLERTRYRRDEAADALGMSRTTLWRKMKQYQL